MKEYKLKINGNDYAVTVNEVDDNIAEVEVNGSKYAALVQEKSTVSGTISFTSPRSRG